MRCPPDEVNNSSKPIMFSNRSRLWCGAFTWLTDISLMMEPASPLQPLTNSLSLMYWFWNPSFKLPVSWPISSGLYLLCMAWCTWETRLSPIWLILALQDVKGSIQYSMHAVELHSCLCLWFTTSGCPLLVCSLARLYNPSMTLPTLQHPGYVHSMREQSSQTHRLPTTQVRTQKHLNCVIASQKCREKTKSKNM